MGLGVNKSKRLKVGSEENEDRISRLPDDILSHILSFLPTNYAVQTCILSSRWRFVWTSIHNFSFDFSFWDRTDWTMDSIKGSWSNFRKFINMALLRSDSVNIDKFSITCGGYGTYMENFPHLNSWVSLAIKRNVRVLELDIPNYDEEELPGSIYSSTSLEVVKLNINFFIETPPPEVCFPNVKILHVQVHDHHTNFIESLFCRCPVLEDLSLGGNFFVSDAVFHINILSPTLKRLKLMIKNDLDSYHKHKVMVRAPNLECLYISDCTVVSYVMHELHSLTTVDIALGEVFVFPDGAVNQLQDLLRCITNIKSLSLSGFITDVLDLAFEDLFPTFPNLTYLKVEDGMMVELSGCGCLPIILSRTPILKTLVIEMFMGESFWWNEQMHVPECLSLHLQEIEIWGFEGEDNELNLVKYMLKNGEVLKRMTFVHNKRTLTKELREKLLMFERGSTACQVEFVSTW